MSVYIRAPLLVLFATAFLAGCLGTEEDTPPPIQTVIFESVSIGGFHACGLDRAGQAYCWGGNANGQLGIGTFDGQLQPVAVDQGNLVFTSLALGGEHTCGLTDTPELYCWGANLFGQLAGPAGVGEPVPGRASTVIEFTSITAGDGHTCGIASDAQAWCWGLAEVGQLGNNVTGTGVFRSQPDSVWGGLRFVGLSAGGSHTCGITNSSEAYCWGRGMDGQLGNGATGTADQPVAVSGGLLFLEISAGAEHTCAVESFDEFAYCWGKGQQGQLGIGSNSNQTEPMQVTGSLKFSAISAGGSYSCGLSGLDAYCWGLNESGQLGDGTVTNRDTPTLVSTNLDFLTIDTGTALFGTATCGFAVDGRAYCWGSGASGQLGTGQSQSESTPTPVIGQP